MRADSNFVVITFFYRSADGKRTSRTVKTKLSRTYSQSQLRKPDKDEGLKQKFLKESRAS